MTLIIIIPLSPLPPPSANSLVDLETSWDICGSAFIVIIMMISTMMTTMMMKNRTVAGDTISLRRPIATVTHPFRSLLALDTSWDIP